MAIDTFVAFTGVYPDAASAEADYDAIKAIHTELGLLDAYDAAVITRNDDGQVKIAKKHETPTRVGGVLGGGIGLATASSSPCSRSLRSVSPHLPAAQAAHSSAPSPATLQPA